MKSVQQVFYSGLLFIVISLAFGIGSLVTLPLGVFASMGPGSFPLLLSGVLLLLGVMTLIKSIKARVQDKTEKERDTGNRFSRWKPAFSILGGVFGFGFLLKGIPAWGIPAFGLIISIYALIFMACLASPQQHLRQTFILATVLALGCYLIFIRLMGLVVPVWPDFIN